MDLPDMITDDSAKENIDPNGKKSSTEKIDDECFIKDASHGLRELNLDHIAATELERRICTQVEYYLGDINLPTDRWLLKHTGGEANKPVPISMIHGFAKMRDFQPYSAVVSALRKSTLLTVGGDLGEETIQRKVAMLPRTTASADNAELDEGLPKKKKKKSKGKSSGKKSRGTGFEEWYCDPPVTPAEFSEESDIYHQSRSFIERIEQCIRRYRARRNMDSNRAHVFDKYLALGGVECGVKAFGGDALNQEALENSNAAEIREIVAKDVVGRGTGMNRKFYHPDNAEHWSIDFEAVVKGFLSSVAPRIFGTESEGAIKSYCLIIQNFLNYVLMHSVCPEYTDQILAARRICSIAPKELWAIKSLSYDFPGDFNRAASTLYGGYYQDSYIPPSVARADVDDLPLGLSEADAERIFQTAIGLVATEEQFRLMVACNSRPKLIKSEYRSFEVIEITMPDEETQRIFARTKDINGVAGKIEPLGIIKVIPWVNPEAPEEDLTDEEEAEQALLAAQAHLAIETQNLAPSRSEAVAEPLTPITSDDTTSLFVEADLLEHMFVGLKFSCTLRTLDIGVHYFDGITGIYTSFYTFLPAEMMKDWKEPRPNDRPPPCVDDERVGAPVADGGLYEDEFE